MATSTCLPIWCKFSRNYGRNGRGWINKAVIDLPPSYWPLAVSAFPYLTVSSFGTVILNGMDVGGEFFFLNGRWNCGAIFDEYTSTLSKLMKMRSGWGPVLSESLVLSPFSYIEDDRDFDFLLARLVDDWLSPLESVDLRPKTQARQP